MACGTQETGSASFTRSHRPRTAPRRASGMFFLRRDHCVHIAAEKLTCRLRESQKCSSIGGRCQPTKHETRVALSSEAPPSHSRTWPRQPLGVCCRCSVRSAVSHLCPRVERARQQMEPWCATVVGLGSHRLLPFVAAALLGRRMVGERLALAQAAAAGAGEGRLCGHHAFAKSARSDGEDRPRTRLLCAPVSSSNVKGRGVSPATPCCVPTKPHAVLCAVSLG